MKAYLLHGKKDLRLEEIPDPVPGPGEVLVKVRSAGICGSDIHYYQQGRVGDYVPLNPFVPGHEFSGDVAQTGVNVSEIMEYQRNFALQMGADAVLNPQDQSMESEVGELVKSGFAIIFEASGAEQAINLALRLVRRGGTIVQLGVLPDKIHIPGNLIMTKELSVMGSFRFANVFDLALNMVASGEIKVKPLVTQIIPFDRLIEGIELASSRKNVIKVEIES